MYGPMYGGDDYSGSPWWPWWLWWPFGEGPRELLSPGRSKEANLGHDDDDDDGDDGGDGGGGGVMM